MAVVAGGRSLGGVGRRHHFVFVLVLVLVFVGWLGASLSGGWAKNVEEWTGWCGAAARGRAGAAFHSRTNGSTLWE